MKNFLKLFLLVVLLNIIRYLAGGPIESFTIMEPMHAVMPVYPEVFDIEFSTTDFAISFLYNFVMWFTVVAIFHLTHPVFRGSFLVKNIKIFGLLCLFFISLSAIYMNHYTEAIKSFYLYSMLDAVIVFTIVALANTLLYPLIFRDKMKGE